MFDSPPPPSEQFFRPGAKFSGLLRDSAVCIVSAAVGSGDIFRILAISPSPKHAKGKANTLPLARATP